RRHLREREGVDELAMRDPAVDLDRLPLHLGQDAQPAAEGEEAEPPEDPGEGAQLRELRHDRRRQARTRASGSAADSPQRIGKWSRQKTTKVTAAMPPPPGSGTPARRRNTEPRPSPTEAALTPRPTAPVSVAGSPRK